MDKKLIITQKNLKGNDGYKIFSVRIKESITKKIDTLATTSGRSRNELIGILLKFALENCELQEED